MAEGLVAPRLASLLSKSVRYNERYPDAGGRVPNEGLRSGRRVVEAGQRDPAEGDVHREERGQMEHVSRIPAESLESQKLAHPDEHAGRKGKVPSVSSTCRESLLFFPTLENCPRRLSVPPAFPTCTHISVLLVLERLQILFKNKKVDGIKVIYKNGSVGRISARNEVILCAGAVNTPQLLLISGVGPVDQLEKHKVNDNDWRTAAYS